MQILVKMGLCNCELTLSLPLFLLTLISLVHEIATAGPNFKAATNFLWPFKLSNPNGGWRARKFIVRPFLPYSIALGFPGLLQAHCR